MIPYGFTQAPQAAPAGMVQQLAAALMAKQRMQQQQQRLGIPTYGAPTAQPGAVTPGLAPMQPPGTVNA